MSSGKTSTVLCVVMSLLLFGCIEQTGPQRDPMPDVDSTAPTTDDDVGDDGLTELTMVATDPQVSNLPPSITLLARQQHPQAIAVDKNAIYWAEYNPGGFSGVQMLLVGETIVRRLSGAELPAGLVADGTHIYWTDASAGRVLKLDKATGDITVLSATERGPFSIAVDTKHVYFTNVDEGSVVRVNKDGTERTLLAKDQDYPAAVAVAGDTVYWATLGDAGELNSVPAVGGAITTHISQQSFAHGFVIDGEVVMWSDANARAIKAHELRSGKTNVLASNQYQVAGLTVDGSNIYWATQTDGAIKMMSKATRVMTTLATGQDTPERLLATDTHIIFTDTEYGNISALAK